MFSDLPASKIKKILIPFLIWVAAGAAVEILFVILLLILRNNGSVDVSPDLFSLLDAAHGTYEYPMLILRNLAAFPFLFRHFRADSVRIRLTLPEVAPYIERVGFFNGSRLKTKRRFLTLFVLPGVFFAIAGNLILYFLGKAEPAERLFTEGVSLSDVYSAGTAFSGNRMVFLNAVLAILFSVIVAPALEELLCRGLIYRRLRTYRGILFSMLISAVLFGLFHLDPVQSIYAFALGLVLADLYEISGSLAAVIVTHASANAIALIFTQIPALNTFMITYRIPALVCSLLLLPASIVLIGLTIGKEN